VNHLVHKDTKVDGAKHHVLRERWEVLVLYRPMFKQVNKSKALIFSANNFSKKVNILTLVEPKIVLKLFKKVLQRNNGLERKESILHRRKMFKVLFKYYG
jgi:hypothetical protein